MGPDTKSKLTSSTLRTLSGTNHRGCFPQVTGHIGIEFPRQVNPHHPDNSVPCVRLPHNRAIAGLPADAEAYPSFILKADCTA